MSKRVILLQCAFHAIMATTFGACFIFLEGSRKHKEKPPEKYTIVDGLWWAVITMTTVGYGDTFPQVRFIGSGTSKIDKNIKTNAGKLLGAVCSFVGTLGIAFPIPVVVAHFNFLYNLDRDDCKVSVVGVKHPNERPRISDRCMAHIEIV